MNLVDGIVPPSPNGAAQQRHGVRRLLWVFPLILMLVAACERPEDALDRAVETVVEIAEQNRQPTLSPTAAEDVDDDKLAADYVSQLYGIHVISLEEARLVIAKFWWDRYDRLLEGVEALGYEPFALRPMCVGASGFLVVWLDLTEAADFPSLVATEGLLTDTLKGLEQDISLLMERNVPPEVDPQWCKEMEDRLRQRAQ